VEHSDMAGNVLSSWVKWNYWGVGEIGEYQRRARTRGRGTAHHYVRRQQSPWWVPGELQGRLAIHHATIIPHDRPGLQWGWLVHTPGPRLGPSAELFLAVGAVLLGWPRDKTPGKVHVDAAPNVSIRSCGNSPFLRPTCRGSCTAYSGSSWLICPSYGAPTVTGASTPGLTSLDVLLARPA
jgi:hypothetical protein